jgi:KDO2-lipid IV(A) lauroyltransferase
LSKVPQKEEIDAEVSFRERVEFAVVWLAVHGMRLLPRRSARAVGAGIAAIAYHALGRLRGVGVRNLQLAFPEMPEPERARTLRLLYRRLGWLLAEFCLMPGYTLESACMEIASFIRTTLREV